MSRALVQQCRHSGEAIRSCKQSDLCDCFDYPWAEEALPTKEVRTVATEPVSTVGGMAKREPNPDWNLTPVRNLRCEEGIWRPAMRRAQAEGTTLTAVIRAYLKRYGKDYQGPEESSG